MFFNEINFSYVGFDSFGEEIGGWWREARRLKCFFGVQTIIKEVSQLGDLD
jgi:hypothetical protein